MYKYLLNLKSQKLIILPILQLQAIRSLRRMTIDPYPGAAAPWETAGPQNVFGDAFELI